MRLHQWLPVSVLAMSLWMGGGLQSAWAANGLPAETAAFGVLRTLPPEEARRQAEIWLIGVGKTDDATRKAFQAIWNSDRPTLDKVAETLSMGDPAACSLLAGARNPLAAAPLDLPSIFQDLKFPLFYRANLALAYARMLSARRVYEEALAAIRCFKPEQVVDPAAYLFHRAVAEHALMRKTEAERSIMHLLEDVADPPARYRALAALMTADMANWRDKDLGWIARKMQNSERRLALARGGRQTQKIQKEALVQLDRMIRQMEQQQQQQGAGQGQQAGQSGRPGSNTQSNSPQTDSYGGNGRGPGNVDAKKFRETAEVWGKLPDKERVQAMLELSREMPPRYREVIENYFKQLAKSDTRK